MPPKRKAADSAATNGIPAKAAKRPATRGKKAAKATKASMTMEDEVSKASHSYSNTIAQYCLSICQAQWTSIRWQRKNSPPCAKKGLFFMSIQQQPLQENHSFVSPSHPQQNSANNTHDPFFLFLLFFPLSCPSPGYTENKPSTRNPLHYVLRRYLHIYATTRTNANQPLRNWTTS
ncbi:hypothetical protein BC939DRAFT_55733 [Gamsiella multidivaricata]|uniref:uncharacterized protein n=1 Tax=Gamsiella multidivaricata TaxID=101098 RepID=UPI00221EE083|nr:uncharacterized protein BC939DRAFT_55733 [Gamsiella multidivaricata]KAI7816226.1 hypothetical protein BC939DRAFT_55733 [Gamsiella multidivaricata]